MTRTVWLIIMALALSLALVAIGAAAADKTVIINNYGATPFVYGGYSYLPLRSATDFLGAALLWDRLKNRALITYNGKELALTVGSPVAIYGGAPVYLPVAPVIVENQIYIPTTAVRQCFHAPVIWDDNDYRVRVKGPHGWGVFSVARRTPIHVIRYFRQSPPRWAGGPGRRSALPPGLAKKRGVVIINQGGEDRHSRGHEGRGQGRDRGEHERQGRGQGHGRGHEED